MSNDATLLETDSPDIDLGLSPPLLFVPGDKFFVTRKVLPEGIKRDEVLSYVELTLEEDSPFPINQQMWGYFCENDMAGVLIYSMYTENLTSEQRELYEKAEYLFPSFLPVLFQKFGSEDIVYYKMDNHFSRLLISNGKVEDIEPVASAENYSEFLHAKLLSDGGVEFTNRVGDSQQIFRLLASQNSRWETDIRHRHIVEADKKNWTQSRIIWKLFVLGLAVAGIFMFAEVAKYATYQYISNQKSLVESRINHVSQIESEDGLASKIQELNTDYYSPIKLLDLLNQSRPDQIYFTSARLSNKNQAEIDGVAANAELVNSYEADLKKSGLTSHVDISDITSRGGKVIFKMTIEFKVVHKDQQSTEGSKA